MLDFNQFYANIYLPEQYFPKFPLEIWKFHWKFQRNSGLYLKMAYFVIIQIEHMIESDECPYTIKVAIFNDNVRIVTDCAAG